jgi:hypothetical protein
MQLHERNLFARAKLLKFDFWEFLLENSPKGVFQPKYSIPQLLNDTKDSHKQSLD